LNAVGTIERPLAARPLTADELARIDAYWRASN
jgi:hypothetical protein